MRLGSDSGLLGCQRAVAVELEAAQGAEETNCADDSPVWRTAAVVSVGCKLLVMKGGSTDKRHEQAP